MRNSYIYNFIINILYFIVCFLILFIASGTLIALMNKEEKTYTDESALKSNPYILRNGKAIYSEIKQIRITSSDEEPATIVLEPFLEYDVTNIPLQEEIVQKKDIIRECIKKWFLSRSWISIESQKESDLKKALLIEINTSLTLGSVSAIYFEDFQILH